MHASCWPLVTAAVHQLGAYVEQASAEHIRFRIDSVCIELRCAPDGLHASELQAFADIGGVEDSLREFCFEALLSVNLDLFRGGGRSTVGVDNDGNRIIFASRIPLPEGFSCAEFDQELQEFCACVVDMHREVATPLADSAQGVHLLV